MVVSTRVHPIRLKKMIWKLFLRRDLHNNKAYKILRMIVIREYKLRIVTVKVLRVDTPL